MAVIILTIGNLMYLLQTSAAPLLGRQHSGARAGRPPALFHRQRHRAENTKEEEFGYHGIANAAGTGASSSAELKNKIMKAVEEFCHGEFRDDVTLVVACIR